MQQPASGKDQLSGWPQSLYRVSVDTRQHFADDVGAEYLASIKPLGALTTILWENCPRIADAQ